MTALSPIAAQGVPVADHRPVVAFMGEFSAGKSTAINLMLGGPVLPTEITATQLPMVWMTHGEDEKSFAVGDDLTLTELAGLDLRRGRLRQFSGLRIERPDPALDRVELIDTPGISDPTFSGDPLALATGLADAVVWCTPANQAWRQSEVGRWRALPEDLRRRSLLLVTRMDTLGSPRNVEKVRRRLEREAGGEFDAILFLDGRSASGVGRDARGSDPAWTASGAAALIEWIGRVEPRRPRSAGPARYAPVPEERHEPAASPAPASRKDEAVAPSSATPDAAPESGSGSIGEVGTPPRTPATTQTGRGGVRQASDPPHSAEAADAPDGAIQKDDTMTKVEKVASTDISDLSNIAGFIGACLVDSDTGLMLGSEGGANFDLETAAAGNTEVVKAKNAAKEALGLNDYIEDILITLGTQYHLIRPLADTPSVFLYVALDKKTANLGMARIQVKKVEAHVAL